MPGHAYSVWTWDQLDIALLEVLGCIQCLGCSKKVIGIKALVVVALHQLDEDLAFGQFLPHHG